MNNRTEPTKAENEAATAELKRETRGEPPLKYRDARSGVVEWLGVSRSATHAYLVRATADDGQLLTVAEFPFDDFDGGKRRITARIMAEELAERINNA